MVDMAKLKEEALQRKRQHEEKELKKQLNKGKKPRSSSASSSRSSSRGGTARNPSAQRALAKQPPQKRKRSVSRWVLDILLFLGALLIMVMMINPFG